MVELLRRLAKGSYQVAERAGENGPKKGGKRKSVIHLRNSHKRLFYAYSANNAFFDFF
jgi:hypothetical protein